MHASFLIAAAVGGIATIAVLPSAADVPEPRNLPSIEACLEAAQTIAAMQACKRIVFTPCLEESENFQSTHGLVMCNSRELEAWEALLAKRGAELEARDPARAERLARANAAWRAFMEAECAYHRSEAGGGSAEGVITTECLSDLTADRVILFTWTLRGNIPY
jgi:uncharacterized protein YecT (DUF1311 family)